MGTMTMIHKNRIDKIEQRIAAGRGVQIRWVECYDGAGNYIEPPTPGPGEKVIFLKWDADPAAADQIDDLAPADR